MKKTIIIGGGAAGMQTALRLSELGIEPLIVEKEADLGGKLRGWHALFPSFTPAEEVLAELRRRIEEKKIAVRTHTEVQSITPRSVTLADGTTLPCDAVVLASGFTLFDAAIKEEYGYGLYDNVFTSVDIERMLNEKRVARADGFYMDIRMFGPGYEEMYREAQQKYNVHFVRGRISEAAPTIDGRVQIKAEDTLTGRPLRMSVDMLVLLVGMRANDDNATLNEELRRAPSGFMAPRDHFLHHVESNVEGIFYAGTVTSPKNIGETLDEAAAAADAVAEYLKN